MLMQNRGTQNRNSILYHNYSLRSKDPRDSVVVLIENSTFFPFFKFVFRHEYDEILNIFSFD